MTCDDVTYQLGAYVDQELDAGARADLRDNRGKTALDIARDNKHAATATLLEANGKSVVSG